MVERTLGTRNGGTGLKFLALMVVLPVVRVLAVASDSRANIAVGTGRDDSIVGFFQ